MPKKTERRDSPLKIQGVDQVKPIQTALWLHPDDLDWLDLQVNRVKRGGWRRVTRSAVLRALIQAAIDQGVNFAGAQDERGLHSIAVSQYRDTSVSQ